MPFGAHFQKKMEDVPAQYLLWLRDKIIDEGGPHSDGSKAVLEYTEDNFTALCKEASDYDPKHKFSR